MNERLIVCLPGARPRHQARFLRICQGKVAMTACEHEAILTRMVCRTVLQLAGQRSPSCAMPTQAVKSA
jgi:hypothetical protein